MDQLYFDPDQFPPDERLTRWASGPTDFRIEQTAPGPFEGRSVVTALGALLIVESILPPLHFLRTDAMVRARRRHHFSLTFMMSGEAHGTTDGAPFHIASPGLLMLEISRPAEIFTSDARSMVIVFPRGLLGASAHTAVHGAIPDSGASRLLMAFLENLSARMPTMEALAAMPVARATCELLAACLPLRNDDAMHDANRDQAVRDRLLDYIESHIAEPLPVERLCEALGVSRSSLYRAAGEQGVAALVRSARLEWVHRRLNDRSDARSLQQICAAAGFRSDSAFSRLFRGTFGYPPSEVRRRAQTPFVLSPHSADAAQAFNQALQRLMRGPNPS